MKNGGRSEGVIFISDSPHGNEVEAKCREELVECPNISDKAVYYSGPFEVKLRGQNWGYGYVGGIY